MVSEYEKFLLWEPLLQLSLNFDSSCELIGRELEDDPVLFRKSEMLDFIHKILIRVLESQQINFLLLMIDILEHDLLLLLLVFSLFQSLVLVPLQLFVHPLLHPDFLFEVEVGSRPSFSDGVFIKLLVVLQDIHIEDGPVDLDEDSEVRR